MCLTGFFGDFEQSGLHGFEISPLHTSKALNDSTRFFSTDGSSIVKAYYRPFFLSLLFLLSVYTLSHGQITYQGARTPVKQQRKAAEPFESTLNPENSGVKTALYSRANAIQQRVNSFSAPYQGAAQQQALIQQPIPQQHRARYALHTSQSGQNSDSRAITQVHYQFHEEEEYLQDGEYIEEIPMESAEGEEYFLEDSPPMDSRTLINARRNAIQAAQGGWINPNPSPEPYPGASRSYTVNNPESCSSTSGSLLGSLGCGGYSPTFGTIGNCPYSPPQYIDPRDCNAAAFFQGGQGFLTGWINAGATFSPSDNNYPLGYNDRGNEFMMNQLYISAGRMVDKNRAQFDLGGRIDILYGTDYFFASSLGLETDTYGKDGAGNHYPVDDPRDAHLRWNDNNGDRRDGTASLYGLAIPQLYAEFFLPIQCGLTIKAGHFYSIMGYESVMAPQNFFYSRTLSTTYGEPTTHTGVLLSQNITPFFSVHGGITRGWDAWESANDGTSGMIGVQWETRWGPSIAFTLHSGETTIRNGDMRTNYSLVIAQQLNPNWRYVLQHDLGTEENGAYEMINLVENRSDATWVSLAQYLECQLTPSCAMGLRVEWFQDKGHSRILRYPTQSVFANGSVSVEGQNYFNVSLAMKWKPVEYITIRPEVRWDWSNVKINSTVGDVSSVSGIYDDFSKRNQCIASIDCIVMF